MVEYAKEKVPLPRIGWKCSADCYQGLENSKIFNDETLGERLQERGQVDPGSSRLEAEVVKLRRLSRERILDAYLCAKESEHAIIPKLEV